MLKRAFLIASLAAALAVGSMGVGASPAQAQVGSGLADVGGTIVLPDTDPRIIATRIINVSLGLIGIILVVIIVYAGFLYMTSGGSPEKTQKALRYIRNAIIGLIIILSSWGIARFVIEQLLDATGTGGGVTTGTGGTGTGGSGGFGGAGSQPFAVVSITPSGEVSTRKVIVKVLFNRPVSDTNAAETGNVVVENASGAAVPGTVVVSGRVLTWTPATPCPAPNEDRRCLEANATYTVRVGGSLESTSGQQIVCGGFSASCEGNFQTGTDVDVTPPLVTLTYPVDGQGVPANSLVDVNAYVQDQTGVSYVSVSAASAVGGAQIVGEAAPAQGVRTPSQFDGRIVWDTAGLAPGSQQTLTATAYDVDSGVATSEPVTVTIRAASCFNGVQDGEETGFDCGGDPSAPTYCGACAGGSCSAAGQCASGVCSASQCVEQPIITSVAPQDGAAGTFVTIRGVNFGQSGQATFLGTAGSPGIPASPPDACRAAGVNTWGPSQVVVQVPAGAQSGPIQVTNNASGLSDATNAPPSPFINDFLVNDVQRPGICAVTPDEGDPGDRFDIVGSGFGNTVATILFGSRTLTSTAWSPEKVQTIAPNVTPGEYPVGVQVGDRMSNPVSFTVTSAEAASGPPEIRSVSPTAGPVGAYVTLSGQNFGETTGQVFFRDVATGNEALADTSFPPMCRGGFWADDAIVVKVPRAFTRGSTSGLEPGTYAVRVVPSAAGTSASNEVNFAVNTEALTPGICAVTPTVAPVGATVTFVGERLTSGPGVVTFAQNREGTVTSWNNTQVEAVIPAGAQSGPVVLTSAQNGLTSNGVQLDVRRCTEAPEVCGTGDVCCADGTCRPAGTCSAAADRAMFAWRTSTGIIPRAPRVVEDCRAGEIPSPSPWVGRTGGDSACVNATVAVRFTAQIDPVSVAPGTGAIRIFTCTGSGSDPCATREPVALAAGSLSVQPANATQDYVTLAPTAPFAPDTLYEVVLSTAVRGAGEAGTAMVEDVGRCGTGNAYCFRFRTRNDISPCSLGGVDVTPHPFTANEQGPLSRDHRAIPFAANDACVVLQCEAFDWTWSTGDSRASITNDRDLSRTPSLGACRQRATANAETGEDPVVMQAATQGVRGTADLYVKFIPPVIERYGPNCDTACVNAAIWAVTNVELDEASVTPENVLIQRCNNENCLEPEEAGFPLSADQVELSPPFGTTDTRLRQISIFPETDLGGVPTPFLVPGQFYKVTIRGGTETGVRSTSGVPLAGLNGPQGFSWVFRVRPGEAGLCQVERIGMAPREKYESSVGAMQAFVATPFAGPDACSESGQQLIPENLSWASSDLSVATLLYDGVIDTGPVPAGCSGQCTFTGASGRAGQIARCGNSIIETTNPRYCVTGGGPGSGTTDPGGRPCVLLAAGGSGGEECDDGNDNNDDACNNRCLWNPVASVADGGTCGDGQINGTEECDFGRVCQGPLVEGATLSVGDSCTSDALAAQCVADGGRCVVASIRGCSSGCRLLGSLAGGSTCGNGDLGDGEECDDGNRANGDGCSIACLHEGSSRAIYASCGNGTLEPGEACERRADGSWPARCNQTTCLNEGTQPCTTPDGTACCGNGGAPEEGEDCDDGNTQSGDGCSAICRLEGASLAYAEPSFCGNGILETGEQCETPGPTYPGDPLTPVVGGNGMVDTLQVARIAGEGTPDENGRMFSLISAALPAQGKTGEAIYGLQCGFTNEASCAPGPDGQEYGLTSEGCCSARPTLVEEYPLAGAADVCRNVRVSGAFNVPMNEESLQANFLVAKRVQDASCPDGLRDVTYGAEEMPDGIRGFFARLWRNIVAFFRPSDALAQRWCAGTVAGRLMTDDSGDGTAFYFTLNVPLEPRTEYRVRFLEGIRSRLGVAATPDTEEDGPLTWSFTTGDRICTVNRVSVRDTDPEHPNFFTASGETHGYVASAQSFINGVPVFISPIPGVYDWQWDNWVFSRTALLDVQPPTLAEEERVASVTARDLVAKGVSGSGLLSARVTIITDTVNEPPTTSSTVQGTASITVNLCENPWPARFEAPFRDEEGSPSLAGTPFENGPFFNFSVGYCRDAGVTGPNEDLPGLVPSVAAPTASDAAQGILRQYLFTFREPALQKDAIGIRIAANPSHLSPLEWYRDRGFTGNPQSMQVDGYEAIRDGRTVYVSAVNTNGPRENGASTDMYSNIYLISYNDGADAVTRQLYDALLASFTFNTNLQYEVSAACETENGTLVRGEGGQPVSCTADHECARFGSPHRCANFKAKVQRDLIRLANFQSLTASLAQVRSSQGSYPALRTGSFLPGVTVSRWPSWNDTFRAALGQGNTSQVAADPVNRFATCGRCAASGTSCVTDTDCPGQGDLCVAQEGYDPATCWNSQNEQFLCPDEYPDDARGSHVYQYRALAGGAQFELAADFEVPPPDSTRLSQNWWKPTPPSFLPGGAQFRYTDVCADVVSAASGSCGDGVLNEGEFCELTGPTATTRVACAAEGGVPDSGTTQHRCFDCTRYAPDPGQPGCFANVQCGNGRIDAGETCDDGTENGRYGRCNIDCSGYGAFCGDGQRSVGEVCDLGDRNTDYCAPQSSCDPTSSCNLTCSGTAAYCGNGRVDAGEQCDGAVTSAEGCPTGQVKTRSCSSSCRWSGDWSACAFVGRCGDGIVGNSEIAPGVPEECDDGNTVNEDACVQCRRNVCGDNALFRGVEECDLGERNGQLCSTAEYGSTCASCSRSCKFQLTQGGYCGDGIRNGGAGEQCDGSQLGNPVPNCRELGFDYAAPAGLQCTDSCQYTGCAYCGSTPGSGSVIGTLFDTLFQQPVPNARVSLYYRGLLLEQQQADTSGVFRFTGLDTNAACSQYRLVVDSYTDNPLTPNFNESLRGGYQPVEIQAFGPSNSGLRNATINEKKGVAVANPDGSGTVAQINMLPQLAENEYVVQLWWEPKGGYNGVQADFREHISNGGSADAFYAEYTSELHDLVVRMPMTYAPGDTPAACAPSPAPEQYRGDGRNTSSPGEDGGFSWSEENRPGITGVDNADSNGGMVSCTNKVRATASATCSGEGQPSLRNRVPCIPDANGKDNGCRDRYGFSGAECQGPPEAPRSGDARVLEGASGAYLFCFHPEWRGINEQRAASTQCTDFILPPQSVFIHANSGQYDILVSKYRLFYRGSHMDADLNSALVGGSRSWDDNGNGIRNWLRRRNAEIRIYDLNGLTETVSFLDVEEARRAAGGSAWQDQGWSEYDNGRACFLSGLRSRAESGDMTNAEIRETIEIIDTISYSPVWTPISIDAGARRPTRWNNGYAGADYRYFADMLHSTHRVMWPRPTEDSKQCWEETCDDPNTSAKEGPWSCTQFEGGGSR